MGGRVGGPPRREGSATRGIGGGTDALVVLLVNVLVDGGVVEGAVAPVEEDFIPSHRSEQLPANGEPGGELPRHIHALRYADVVQSKEAEELHHRVVDHDLLERFADELPRRHALPLDLVLLEPPHRVNHVQNAVEQLNAGASAPRGGKQRHRGCVEHTNPERARMAQRQRRHVEASLRKGPVVERCIPSGLHPFQKAICYPIPSLAFAARRCHGKGNVLRFRRAESSAD